MDAKIQKSELTRTAIIDAALEIATSTGTRLLKINARCGVNAAC